MRNAIIQHPQAAAAALFEKFVNLYSVPELSAVNESAHYLYYCFAVIRRSGKLVLGELVLTKRENENLALGPCRPRDHRARSVRRDGDRTGTRADLES